MSIQYVALAFSILLVSGCAASINEYNARQHAQAGVKAGKSGEFAKARKEFAKALTNARLAKADPKMVAALSYEYGRYSGMICDWVEGEKGLTEAHALDQQNGGPAYMSLVELGEIITYLTPAHGTAILRSSERRIAHDDQADTNPLATHAAVFDRRSLQAILARTPLAEWR